MQTGSGLSDCIWKMEQICEKGEAAERLGEDVLG